MRTMTTTEAARAIGRTVLESQREPIEITLRGRPVAVLVSLEEWLRVRSLDLSTSGTT